MKHDYSQVLKNCACWITRRHSACGGEERCMMENGVDTVAQLFEAFCHASTCRAIISAFQALTDHVGLTHADHRNFYRKLRARVDTWKAHALWAKLDKRANHKEYRRGEACANTKVIIIGGGICGLRVAIETALLGARTVVVEKRDRFSRNNVLHLWPFLITDLKNLGAKKFYGKFCAGAIDHISIRQLQCILLKAALLVGVEIHLNVGFEDIIEPTTKGTGWRVKVDPENHPLSEYEFDVLIGADGKRNTLKGFKRKEFRGKLAIAITANFINRNTQAEARVEEISGVAFIFNQKFFKDLNEAYGIDLENIVYYKDETHYFVMTAKKQSLLEKGVLKRDYADTAMLLGYENVDQDALANYAREAAAFCTNHMLPHTDFAVNHYGRPDLAMFDFTSLFQAENSCMAYERQGKKLLTMLVGDSLLEPFWPTGSGCARGFLGALDGAWMIKQWSSCKMTPLQVIAERESVYQLLSQTTPENLRQDHNKFGLDPASRYTNMKQKWLKPKQVMHLYDTGENTFRDEVIEIPKPSSDNVIDTYSLLRWCQKILNTGEYKAINVTDLSSSWKSGLAFCALIHYFKPDAIDIKKLNEADVMENNQLAFDVASREFSIAPVMTGEDMAACACPDKLSVVSYLTQFHDLFKKQRPPSEDFLNSSFDDNRKHRSPNPSRLSFIKKLRSSRSVSKLMKSKKEDDVERQNNVNNSHHHQKQDDIGKINSVFTNPNWEQERNDIRNGNVELTRYKMPIEKLPIDRITSRLDQGNAKHPDPQHRVKESKLPMDEITNRLTNDRPDELKGIKMREEMMPVVKVSKMAELLVSKFKKNCEEPPPEPLSRRVKGQPMMVASQPASEFCFFCKKRVYIMERMSAENVFFHRQCFKCDFCAVILRNETYSVDKTSYGDATRFFCPRHALPQSRFGRPARKRVAEDAADSTCEKRVPLDRNISGPSPTKVSTTARSPKKTPDLLSPVAITEDNSALSALKTPERIEFENTMEGLIEETEEEQYEHNLSMSLARNGALEGGAGDQGEGDMEEDEEMDSDDSDLEELLSEMDEMDYEELLTVWTENNDFQEAVDLYKSGKLEESLCLAKESLKRSTENLLDDGGAEGEDGYTRIQEGEEDTEVEDYDDDDYETDDSDTELEEESQEPASGRSEPKSAWTESKSSPSVTPSTSTVAPSKRVEVGKPVVSATSPGVAVSKARANFFTAPPEPIRLDPFKMFGMARKNPVPEPVQDSSTSAASVVKTGESEATDSQVKSEVLSNKDAKMEDTDEDVDDAFVSAEFGDDEKVAVSRAMEQLLVDMDHKSESLSDSCDHLKESSEGEGEDDVFREYRAHLESRDSIGSLSGSEGTTSSRSRSKHSLSSSGKGSKSSSRRDKLYKSDSDSSKKSCNIGGNVGGGDSLKDLSATEKSVLRSVKEMDSVSSSLLGSGETTLQVLQSINKTGTRDINEMCIQYIDDRFVTKRPRGSAADEHRSLKSSSLNKSDSSCSLTISTPSHSSNNTSNSSLTEEYERNKQFATSLSDDERPDSQMLRDYTMTMSQALEEEEGEEFAPLSNSPDGGEELVPLSNSPVEGEELDQTLNAEEPVLTFPGLENVSPRLDLGDVSCDKSEYTSPLSGRASSVYETLESSLTEPNDVQTVTMEEEKSVLDKKRKSGSSSGVSTKDSSKPDNYKSSGLFGVRRKKSETVKSPKVIKSTSVNTPVLPVKSQTIIRPISHRSREGSVESNPLEKDAWGGDSSSCSSLNSVKSTDATQKTWRPLPPVPTQSLESPKQSKTAKAGAGRKLPDPAQVQTKSPVVFQSQFMKKAFTDSNNEFRTPVITSQPRPLPPKPVEALTTSPVDNGLQKSNPNDMLNTGGSKTKVTVDYSKLNSDKDSDSEKQQKKKRIPVATALKQSIKPTLSNNSGKGEPTDVHSDDIPFADDSNEEEVVEEKFFTPVTSVKLKPKIERKEGDKIQARTRILPTPPKMQPALPSPEKIRDIRKAELEKFKEEARLRARLKSDKELGISETPSKYKRTVSSESSQSASDRAPASEKEDASQKVTFNPDIPESSGTPKQSKSKKKKNQSHESSLSSIENLDAESSGKKDKSKKRSLLASILGVKTPSLEKQKDRDEFSSSNDHLDEKSAKKKKSKTPKTEKKKKEKDKKRKTASVDDSLLSDNMKDLKIGTVFTKERRGGMRRIMPPKASVDDFTDTDEDAVSMTTSCTSLNDSHRRIKSDHGPLSEDELNARITRKIQHAARKQQKQQEQKRLRQAQEIQRKLQEVDVKQRELEEKGVNVERALRGEGPEGGRSETELMQEWFNLVHEKNALVRLESELMVSARELELEDRQGRLQQQLRESLSLDGVDLTELENDDVFEEPDNVNLAKIWSAISRHDSLKSPGQRDKEQKIYQELIDVVEERDRLVAMLEDERLREQEEDKDLESVMKAKGFALSPRSGSKILRKNRASKMQT
ncbi:protein-methionine sulfoxide oxidase mical3b-like isoform X3 [Dreissena polymorpha]|uniref:protein-methionine sulfoxide oxidase mical3b-like isoform X3 n=1 Tax=Dreissena polymorpha TaxID=45954 RepID=UPI002264014D|nr:protein-methionine sulfoxide oxidase mical3b-like isoform X3 [Dreissena polymorpha]